MNNSTRPTVGMVSLGCAKNLVDSENMLGMLRDRGYEIVNDPAQAEIIFVNTCGFIESAKQESIDAIFEMAEYKKTGKLQKLFVTGCLAQRYADALASEMPEVDGFMGVADYARLYDMLDEAMAGKRPIYMNDGERFFNSGRVLTSAPYSAYVKISDGCNNRCTYCAIPLIRGGYRSRPKADILNEVRRLAGEGVKEFTLIAQDTTRYGTDLGGPSRLPELIEEIAAIPGVAWLRTLYCYPERVDDRLLGTIERLPNVCNYLDLPMQHISQHILNDMNRTDTSEHIREVCEKFKARGMMLRTTMMVGFPGETDEDFDELMDFVQSARFDRMGAFTFSPEEGTVAADMENQVDEAVKQARYDALMTLQHQISLEQNKARVGTVCRVLVERKRGNRYVGRSEFEAPETDGNIYFGSSEPCTIGEFVNVRITGAKAYDLMGERV